MFQKFNQSFKSKNAIKERYNKLLKDQWMTLKTHVDANHSIANFFEKEINSLSKRKCGNVIYFEKKVHLENTFPK